MRFESPVPFWKMSGSGNDFVVIDNRDCVVPPDVAPAFTRAVCRHRVSVGADGVVLIGDSDEPGVNFTWRYVNADGSDGEMCGNGAMCGARFAVLNGIAPADCVFRTESGLVHAWVATDSRDPRVRIAVEEPGALTSNIAIDAAGRELDLHAVTVGVPHAVLIVEDVDQFAPGRELLPIGRAVRHHPVFAPAGTNLNVIAVTGPDTVRMRTYERGVEDETLACGTGSIASAIVATSLGLVAPPVNVVTTGGRVLRVDFTWRDNRASDVALTGEARVIVRGEIGPEALD
ncbi:MAG: diaminopimelate epimerase [Thermomicrobiales bacterium]|nr:diaminopimelate epimerase [Thermomicrobiales bacterium]